VRKPQLRLAVRHWALWPLAALSVVWAGGIAALELLRIGRPGTALVMATALASLSGAAAAVLVMRLLAAQSAALRDPLTGLPNRELLDDRITQALARSRRTQEAFALLVVDLDGFKGVNDVRGHEVGNSVLRTIARRLESVVRQTDTVARVGGDEFVVLSLGTAEDDEAAALAGRIRQALRRSYRVDGTLVEIDASIGWALFPQDGLTPSELLSRADGQMYATKRDTSEESVLTRPPLDGGVVRDLEHALAQGEIVVHYQPIVELPSSVVRSVEALVRQVRGENLVGPAEFVPHVERTPLVRTLTLAVARDALRRLHEWEARGHMLDAAINVPYRMIDDGELIAGLEDLLEKAQMAPERLTLEVVPSGPSAGSELDATVVRHLRELGVRLSLDDLGRASSVAAIRMLPLHQVKIDSMFLHEAGRGGPGDAIVRSLVGLAHGLGLETVAEGIESKLALEAAISLGCDYAQGFYLGHPMPADRLSDWLAGTWPVVAVST
jgi:diguanylate cyclase (GGDEF)-like protein